MTNVLFMGRKRVAADTLTWLSQKHDVNVVGVITDDHLQVSPTYTAAKEQSLPVLSRESAEHLIDNGEMRVDLGVSVLYWQKIRQPVLQRATRGVINFHPAPLPEFKGTGGYNLAVLEGHSEWAVSAHYVDEHIDTGELIDVDWFGIDQERETAQSLEARTQPILLAQIKRITHAALRTEGKLDASPNIGGRYIARADMEAMKEVKDGDDVERKIRAFWFPPYDGAFIHLGGVKCTLVHRPILESLADPDVSNVFTAARKSS